MESYKKSSYLVNTSRYFDLDQERKVKKRRRLKRYGILAGVFVLLAVLGGGLFLWRRDSLLALMRPISFVAQLVNPVVLKETDGRVNILVLGLDSRGKEGLLNTDTILVGSFSLTEGNPVLISIPRDFWVRSDNVKKGWQGKINTAYASAAIQSDGKVDETKGVFAAKAVVEEVLGIPIHYWAVVDFEGFKEIIDTLGGIEVCVDRAFDNLNKFNCTEEICLNNEYSNQRIHFDAGCQTMDGNRALIFSRMRIATNGEGSDFARVRRQQKVVLAVKDKIISLSLLLNPGKIASLYRQFTGAITTNVSLGEAQRALDFLYKFNDNLGNVASLVLDPASGLTYHPASFGTDGAYVLLPKAGQGNFSAVRATVQKLLFEPVAETISE